MKLTDDITAQIAGQTIVRPLSERNILNRLFPKVEDASTIVITCDPSDYSASRIARAVEDCDAHLLNLNVTADNLSGNHFMTVELRVNHRNGASVARSLERYGYSVVSAESGDNPDNDTLRRRVNELLRYIDT